MSFLSGLSLPQASSVLRGQGLIRSLFVAPSYARSFVSLRKGCPALSSRVRVSDRPEAGGMQGFHCRLLFKTLPQVIVFLTYDSA